MGCIQTFTGHTSWVKSAVFSNDGTNILTASDDKTAKLWSVENGPCIQTFTGHTCWVYSAVFSNDGASILTASSDRTAKLWSVENGACIQTFTGHSDWVKSAVFFKRWYKHSYRLRRQNSKTVERRKWCVHSNFQWTQRLREFCGFFKRWCKHSYRLF